MANDILKPEKGGNPRAAQTRIEGRNAGAIGGQRAHDLRIGPQPNYVDPTRSHLNREMIPPLTGTRLRKICQERRALRDTTRAMKSNAAVGMSGIITFGHEAQKIFETLTPDQQDAAYLETAEAIAKRLNTTLTGLVAHADESAPHAHYQIPAYDLTGHPVSATAKRGAMRDLQTIVAEVMGRHAPGIERGRSKIDRLKAGASPADVVNRSVAQLHADLPTEIAEREAQLTELTAKVEKNTRLAAAALEKAATDEARAAKALKNAATYERRAKTAQQEIEALAAEVTKLEAESTRLNAVVQEREAFIVGAERIADTQWDRANAAIAAQSAAEARREAAEREATQIREKALKEAQETSAALQEQARDEATREARRITEETSKRLEQKILTEGEQALLKAERERNRWKASFRLLRALVRQLVPADLWQTISDAFDNRWSKRSENPDRDPEPPSSSSSGPTKP